MNYSAGTYVVFLSVEPQAHLDRMFGHSHLPGGDFCESEHVGLIQSAWDVPWGKCYQVLTVRPLAGFTCIVGEDKILREVDFEELNEDGRVLDVE